MELHQFAHIFHLFGHRQLQLLKYSRNHPATYYFMSMECPAMAFLKTFGSRFCYIVQDSSPAKPKIVRSVSHIIQNLQGMIKIIFMSLPFNKFRTSQVGHLRENNGKEPAI